MNESILCPFCGSEDYYIAVTDNPFSYDTYSTAHCSKCHATGPFVAESYLEDEPKPTRDYMEAVAKEKWQTRPIEDDLRKRIAELEADNKKAFDFVRELRIYCIWANWDNPDTEDDFNEFDVEVCKWLSKFMEREE